MSDPVAQLHSLVYQRFLAATWFNDIVVLLGEDGVLASDIAQILKTVTARTGKKGAAIVIDRPLRDVDAPDLPGPEWQIKIPIGIYEWPIANRVSGGSEKTIEEIISKAAALTHHFYVAHLGTQVSCAPEAVTPVPNKQQILVAELMFDAAIVQQPETKVSAPKVSGTAAAVTIEPASRYGISIGSTVYYTTNGSYPRPDNDAAILLGTILLNEAGQPILSESDDPLLAEPVASFTVAEGTLVLAAAYKTGEQPSDLAGKQF